MHELGFGDLYTGQQFDFGRLVLSEEDIITFARQYDPIPFHIDKQAALESPFKGLIASGPHLFHIFYTREWVPRFKNSVYAGRGIQNWMLHKPIYAGDVSRCTVTVKTAVPKPERSFGVVHWYFDFTAETGERLQELDLIVMHKL